MAELLRYNLTDSFDPSTIASGVAGGTITAAGTLTGLSRGTAGYATDNVASALPASGATDAASAVSTGSYFTLSITPQSGKTISLTSLVLNMARGGAATPRGYAIRSSRDSFAANLGTANLTAQRPTFQTITIDLSGSDFQSQSGTITFNVYVFAPSTVNAIDFDDVVINGSISDGGTIEQEGFRWRSDDGSETTATWLAAQDVNITRQKSQRTRLRILLNSTQDRGSEQFELQYRKVGDATWENIA